VSMLRDSYTSSASRCTTTETTRRVGVSSVTVATRSSTTVATRSSTTVATGSSTVATGSSTVARSTSVAPTSVASRRAVVVRLFRERREKKKKCQAASEQCTLGMPHTTTKQRVRIVLMVCIPYGRWTSTWSLESDVHERWFHRKQVRSAVCTTFEVYNDRLGYMRGRR
jgi:hypothetical protein